MPREFRPQPRNRFTRIPGRWYRAGMAKTASKYTIRIPAVDGSFAMDVHVPPGPTRLQDIVPLAQNIARVQGERSIASERKAGREISCKAACGACCRQLVPISAPEAFRLADHILGLGDDLRDDFLARVDAVESAIVAAGLMRELEGLTAGEPVGDARSLASRYFEKNIACPFLVDERCAVYPERPLVCRDYLVTSPAESCATPGKNRIRIVPVPPGLSAPLSRVAASLLRGEPAMITLSIAMRWVDAHAEWGFKEWPGRDVMRALLKELGVPEADLKTI
jgi:Fe-S-cluster containining protein